FNKATDAASLQRPDTSIGGTAFTFKFGTAGYIDVLSMGTLMNARNGADTGVSFRVRNPFYHWTLKLPTTGYKQPILQFAVHRSNSGPTTNAISYTTDGTNYITTGLSSNSFTIGTTWAQFSFDFSSIPGVDDNPNFGVMFINSGDTTGGNNRFDNITLDAYPK
ncbi:MAG: hypothetical protein EBX41_02105, partial [Chitinophagia bacterium]|nr:hypothetical protein [Chitinophagia bacterium]